jgi:hypothetical protein
VTIQNRTKKPLALTLSGRGKGHRGRDAGRDLTNVQYKCTWNCPNESPLYNDYIMINKNGSGLQIMECSFGNRNRIVI